MESVVRLQEEGGSAKYLAYFFVVIILLCKFVADMSKIILEFDGVEEEREAQYALDGFKYSMVIDYILQDLRQVVKHSASLVKRGEFATKEEVEVCNAIRERLYSYLQDYNISATE